MKKVSIVTNDYVDFQAISPLVFGGDLRMTAIKRAGISIVRGRLVGDNPKTKRHFVAREDYAAACKAVLIYGLKVATNRNSIAKGFGPAIIDVTIDNDDNDDLVFEFNDSPTSEQQRLVAEVLANR